MKKYKFIVDSEFENERLDKYLLNHFKEVSRNSIQKDIKSGNVLVNGNKVKTGYSLNEDDIVEYIKEIEENITLKPIKMDLDIVYEDDYLLVVNKEKGLVVHPAVSYNDVTLVNGLLYHTDKLSDLNGDLRPGIVHRLDKDTSGLLVVAKNNDVHEDLALQFKNREVIKKYYALVYGSFDESSGTIDMPIKRSDTNRLKMMVSNEGRNAVTEFKVIKEYLKYSLLDVNLITGRTHQIRVHLDAINHPIVGDPLYGNRKVIGNIGQYLHSYSLTFVHPIKKEPMTFKSKLPLYFEDFIKNLA